MLDFSFTPAQEEYRLRLRELALSELLPRYQRGDAEQAYPYDQVKQVLRFAAEFWKGREAERDLISVGITAEEVARGDLNCVLTSLGPPYMRHFLPEGSALSEHWRLGLESGDKIIALCLTESSAGSDMGRIQTRAEQRGERFVLNGEKNSVSFLNADLFYVFARSDPTSSGWSGLSAFLVPRETSGLSFEPVEDLGCRAIPRGILRLNDVEVPADSLVGEPGRAFVMISRFFDINRAVIALKCVGAPLQTLEETIAYTRKRIQFGAPIATYQGVSFPLSEAATFLELTRWQCYRVLWMRQQNLPCQREGAMVKWWGPKIAAEVIHKCLLFHGHYGYSKALPIQQRLRDVIGWQIGDGSEEVMKLIITRSLFGRDIS